MMLSLQKSGMFIQVRLLRSYNIISDKILYICRL